MLFQINSSMFDVSQDCQGVQEVHQDIFNQAYWLYKFTSSESKETNI